jgi:predicted tellurium resistance membrane protein TerC
MHRRMMKYALAMGIRMVCLILIFVVDGWFKLVMVAGAVFLPWIAVVIANGGDQAEVHSDSLLDYAPLGELEGTAWPPEQADNTSAVLQGEVINDDDDDEPTHGQERRAS